MGWYFLFAVLVLYVVVVTYLLWSLLGDYAVLQEREERQSQRAVKVMEQRSHYEQLATKHAALVDELEKELAEAKRELETASNECEEIQDRRMDLAKMLEATVAELESVKKLLKDAEAVSEYRRDQLQELANRFDEIKSICNT